MFRTVSFLCFLTALTAFAQTSPTAAQKDSEKLPTLVTRAPSGDKQKADVEKPKTVEKPKGDLSKEAFVIEEITTLASFEADGTGSRETTSRVRIQSDAGVQAFGLLTLVYQKAFEDLDVRYVRVRKPDGRMIETSMENVQDLDSEITRAAPFYSDVREKHVAVKGLGVGDTLEWNVVQHEAKAIAPGHFWVNYEFTTQAIILNEHFTLSVPRDLAVKVRSPDFKFEVREQSGRRIYEWKHAQLERKEDLKEKFQSPFRLPEPDVLVSSFGSWDEIGRWYDSLQKERVKPSPEVRAKALELTKNAKTDEEKIRALYDYVATQFRYIGVAFGIGRYQPHAADDVLGNSYGDCKDKHTLLASLLQAVGIEAWPALINSSHLLDADVPSPAQFDHVITVVPRGKEKKELLWLDTTAEVAPFGQLVTSLRDKQALVIPPNAPASLVRTPVEPAFADSEQFRITGTLSESGELLADVEQQMRGDSEIIVRSAFRQVPQPRWTDLVQNLSYARGYAGTVSEVTTTAPEKTSEPFRFSYKYDRKDYSDWSNKRITPPLPPIGVGTLGEEHEKSGQPVLLDAPAEMNYTSEIHLPAGYTPEIPQGIDLKTDFAEYHSKYSLAGDVLRAERRLSLKKAEVPSASYAQYKEFQRKVSDDATSWITFTAKDAEGSKKSGAASSSNTPASKPTWPAMPDSEAGRLYGKGFQLFQMRDFRGALEKYEEAAKTDPKLPGIWSEIGKMHLALNEVDQGLQAMQRQVKETPEVPGGYKILTYALMSLHRESDAIRVARDLVKVSPEDSDGQFYVGYCLVVLKQYKEAIEALEQAVKLNSSNPASYFQLGNAYMGAGEGDKAYEAYAQAVDLDLTYSGVRNDAAYALTEKDVHLKEATLWAREAVTDKEDQTRNIDLDHLEMKDLWVMNQLSAYWDTLGWAFFHGGDYAAAERYLLAAWWLRQDTVVGDHVGQVYEKMRNPRKAARFYSLANAAPDAGSKAPVREHLAHLSPAVIDKSDYAAALSAMRTFEVPRITPKKATAEFFVLFSNNGELRIPAMERAANDQGSEGKPDTPTSHFVAATNSKSAEPQIKASVEQVKFISGSEELRKAEDVLRKIDFQVPFPDNSLTKIVRRGILACEPNHSTCEFVLITMDAVRSVN